MGNTKKIKAKVKYKLRGATKEKWETINPVLGLREPALIIDENGNTVAFKVGNGVASWSDLPTHNTDAGQSTENKDAVYVKKEDASYELLKGLIDDGKVVLIVDGTDVYYCQSITSDDVNFYCNTGEEVKVLSYMEGNDEPYNSFFYLLRKTDVLSTYDPNSYDPISGIGVADALSGFSGGGEKPWELLEDITLEEAVMQIDIPRAKLQGLKELHISAYILPTDTNITSQDVSFGTIGRTYWSGKANPKATGSIKAVMDIYISPRKTPIFDGTVSAYDYTLTGTSYKGLGYFRTADMNDEIFTDLGSANAEFWMRTSAANPMAVGTRMKVWGR